MVHNQVVIRRSLLGNILLLLSCIIFVAAGILMIQIGQKLIGILSVIFFGGGGILYLIFMAHKPIAVISSKGITVPYGWGSNFAAWENINRFEVVEQTTSIRFNQKQKYIGIFVTDAEGIVGTGSVSQNITKGVTGWENAPDILINLSFSFVKIEKVMEIIALHQKADAENIS